MSAGVAISSHGEFLNSCSTWLVDGCRSWETSDTMLAHFLVQDLMQEKWKGGSRHWLLTLPSLLLIYKPLYAQNFYRSMEQVLCKLPWVPWSVGERQGMNEWMQRLNNLSCLTIGYHFVEKILIQLILSEPQQTIRWRKVEHQNKSSLCA